MQTTYRKALIKPCSFSAAEYAMKNWHYSKSMPVGKLIKYGVYVDNVFEGCIIYGRGANMNQGMRFNLGQKSIVELVRVAAKPNKRFLVSQVLGFSLKLFKKTNPGIKVVISYADLNQGHDGTIYQATNWIYAGLSASRKDIKINGKSTHAKTLSNKFGTASIDNLKKIFGEKNVETISVKPKHVYYYFFDKSYQKYIKSKPYPCAKSVKATRFTSVENRRFDSDLGAPSKNLE